MRDVEACVRVHDSSCRARDKLADLDGVLPHHEAWWRCGEARCCFRHAPGLPDAHVREPLCKLRDNLTS